MKTAKSLVDDTKSLVAGATGTQESLANAAQNSVKTIASLAEVVKLGAASIGSDQPEAQVCVVVHIQNPTKGRSGDTKGRNAVECSGN